MILPILPMRWENVSPLAKPVCFVFSLLPEFYTHIYNTHIYVIVMKNIYMCLAPIEANFPGELGESSAIKLAKPLWILPDVHQALGELGE